MAIEINFDKKRTKLRDTANITPRQLFLGLMKEGFITPEEAIAAAQSRTAPAAIAAVLDSLPPMERATAYITWGSMMEVQRSNPLVATIAATTSLSEKELDLFFFNCSQL